MDVVTQTDLPLFPLLASGKVRDVYEISGSSHLLFVATDRISCYDAVCSLIASYQSSNLELTLP